MRIAAPLRRRFAGATPFEEVWFIEGSIDLERAFWLRYSITATDGGATQAVWAAVVHPGGVHVGRAAQALVHPPAPGAVHSGPAGELRPGTATGRVDELAWDLGLGGGWRHHDHVPRTVARLGLSGRHYLGAALDLSVSGTLRLGDRTLELRGAPAVCGHIFGARSNTEAWGWVHCAAFDEQPGVVFEGIAARLRPAGLTLPPATSLVLRYRGVAHSFTRTHTLFDAGCALGDRSWSFSARNRQLRIHGRATLPSEDRCVRVRYDHAVGDPTFVRNSPLSRLELTVEDRRTGRTEVLRSGRASFERAQRAPHEAPPHLAG